MADLGWAYEYGKGGLAKDEVHAVKLYRQAADAGDAHGNFFKKTACFVSTDYLRGRHQRREKSQRMG